MIKKSVVLCLVFWLTACAQLPDNSQQKQSVVLTQNKSLSLYRPLQHKLSQNKAQSAFRLLGDNVEAFHSRLMLIDHAQQSIDAQYYAIEDELTGRLFLHRLLMAADRGVRVRLLIDDLNTDGRDALFSALDQHPYMSIRAFNPFNNRHLPRLSFAQDFPRLNRRMHNKALIIDDFISIVGGRNIGDKYFSEDSEIEFGDLELLSAGPISHQVSVNFDRYWNHKGSYSYQLLHHDSTAKATNLESVRWLLKSAVDSQAAIKMLAYKNDYSSKDQAPGFFNDIQRFVFATAHLYSDLPQRISVPRDSWEYAMAPQLYEIAKQTQREIIIFSPYFIPKHWGLPGFQQLRDRKVDVKVLTNSLAALDVSIVHAGYRHFRKPLLRMGVKLHEFRPDQKLEPHSRKTSVSSLHAKSFIFDRRRLFVGSLNLDPRSTQLNTEMGILVNSPELAQQLAEWLDQNINQYAY